MPCYHPLKVWNLGDREGGKKTITFKDPKDGSEELKIPCGHCLGCKQRRAQEWAIRCTHESQLYENNWFVTLTYNDDELPDGQNCNECREATKNTKVYEQCKGKHNWYTTCQRDLTLFLKKLRDKYGKFRYFGCSEYGDNGKRPHYHILLFGIDFRDLKVLTRDKETLEPKYFTSESLEKLWGKGYTLLAPVVYETARYVAGYVYKKVGKNYQEYANRIFNYIDYETGEYKIVYLKPLERINPINGNVWTVAEEKQYMSRNPGIASGWYDKHKYELLNDGMTHIGGMTFAAPEYYIDKIERDYPERYKEIKAQREAYAEEHQEEFTEQRLAQKEAIKKRMMQDMKRDLDLKKHL